MSLADTILAVASKYLGAFEVPDGSNDDRGGIITKSNEKYGLRNEPYCAMWCGYVADESGAPDDFQSIFHPYTGTLFDRAKAKGWTHIGGPSTRPASLFTIAGKHVGWVLRAYNDNTFQTLEANAANAIRSLRRSWDDGWVAITYPGLGEASLNQRTGYGWDDLEARPSRFGGWMTKAGRDKMATAFQESHPGWWVRPIKINRHAKFAFEAGKPGTFGKTWSYGPWLDRQVRDHELAQWKKKNHANVRTWNKTLPDATTTGSVSGIGATQ